MPSTVLRVVSFNIHHGANREGVFNIEKTIEFLRMQHADIIGLNEVDRYWSDRSRSLNLPKRIAERLKLHHFFSPSISKDGGRRAFGNMVLSRFPIVKKSAIPLRRRDLVYRGSRWSEQRVCLATQIQLPHERIAFLFTHLGLPEVERGREMKKILSHISTRLPTILAGDFNSSRNSGIFKTVEKLLPHRDYCGGVDHMFASRHCTVKTLRSVPNHVSDHPLIFAEFLLRDTS